MKSVIKYSSILFLLLSAITANGQELVSGSVVGSHIFGLARDVNGDPLLVDEAPLIYSSSDFGRKLSLDGRAFVVSGFGDTLGGLYITRYDSESKRYLDTVSFELADVGGLSRPRGGVATPWHSVLFGETGVVDGANPEDFIDTFKAFYKGKADLVNPYNYGWIGEAIVLDGKGNTKVIKDYAAGRVFASQLFMMPDGKSLYLFDGENAGLLYLFVAEEANSLTKGALYGVSLQDGKVVYDLLGRSSALRMNFKLKKIGFDELFDVAPIENGGCPDNFVSVSTLYGDECLKVNKRNEKYAGLFEPVRMLAIQRKGHPLTKFTKVEFGRDGGRIELTGGGGVSMTYALGQSADLDSHYVIQETQQ